MLYCPIIALLVILPLNWYIITAISSLFLYAVRYLNEFLLAVRGRPLHYIDFYSVKEAMRVSSGYDLIFNRKLLFLLIVTIITIVITWLAIYKLSPSKAVRKQKKYRKLFYGIALLAVSLLFDFNLQSRVTLMDWYENRFVDSNGVFFALYSEYINSKPTIPYGYKPGLSEQILSQYTEQTQTGTSSPDEIYVIMNESLADYSLLGELNLEVDPLEKIHSLSGSSCYGKCAVNVFGGNTCNSEFEFLTGDSLMFMPAGTIPYLTYTLSNHPSIAQDLHQLGYEPTAIHPYFSQEWKRSTIYPQLGFSQFISGEVFSSKYEAASDVNIFEDLNNNRVLLFGDNLEYLRGFVTDAECYRKIQSIHNNKNFIFTVTIQNHGGYNLMDSSDLESITSNHHLNEYLNLVTASDKAFSDFLEQLKHSEKKTVVLMFGDHQPGITSKSIFQSMYSDNGNELQKRADQYTVPYIFWANYDVDWKVPDYISLNYLSAALKKNCDLPLSQFDQLRLDCMDHYPVITSNYCVNEKGEFCSVQDALDDKLIQDYAIVQYDRLS